MLLNVQYWIRTQDFSKLKENRVISFKRFWMKHKIYWLRDLIFKVCKIYQFIFKNIWKSIQEYLNEINSLFELKRGFFCSNSTAALNLNFINQRMTSSHQKIWKYVSFINNNNIQKIGKSVNFIINILIVLNKLTYFIYFPDNLIYLYYIF